MGSSKKLMSGSIMMTNCLIPYPINQKRLAITKFLSHFLAKIYQTVHSMCMWPTMLVTFRRFSYWGRGYSLKGIFVGNPHTLRSLLKANIAHSAIRKVFVAFE